MVKIGVAKNHNRAIDQSSFLAAQTKTWSDTGEKWRTQLGLLAWYLAQQTAFRLRLLSGAPLNDDDRRKAALAIISMELGFSQRETALIANASRTYIRRAIDWFEGTQFNEGIKTAIEDEFAEFREIWSQINEG
jgi:hypothetical protein